MAEALAGFVCGYALALIVTPLAAIAIVRARTRSAVMEQIVPSGTSMIAVSMILHFFAFMGFTAIGMLLGLVLSGIEDRSPAGGLGSPNQVFTALTIAITAIAVLPLAVAMPRWRVPLMAGGLTFLVCFGWVMPWLSLLGPEG